ncbi:hypothetical protein FRC07_001498 [Ceratobasidium sp. 392]|nr:hypothetical protein FRC07_001498 [Ceratobasidium sp. 392]
MSNPHETRLESLWKDAYQFVHSREGGFREETLADQTQAMVQRMLRAAAKERVASFLGRNECSNCTAAGMAWTEVSARTNEASRLSQWDQAWDYRWHQAWMRRWAEHWRNESSSQDTSMRLKFLSNLETFESGPKIDGSVSGRAAGRVLVKAQAAATAGTTCRSHPEVSPQFCESPIEAPKGRHLETTNSQVGPVSDMSHRIGTMTIEEIELAPQATNITENPSTPSVYQSLARDSDICPIWVGTFEEAFKIGWAAAWEQYFAMGRKVADRLLQDPKQGPGISSTDPASQAGSTLPQTPSELVKRIFKPSSVNKGVVLKDPVPSPATAQLLHTQHPNIQTPTDGSSKVVTSQAGHAQSRLLVDKIRKLLVPQIRRTLQVGSSQIQTIIESQLSREQNKIKQNALASAPKIPLKFKESFARFNLTDRASEAWQHIAKIENSPERKLKSSAASEWDRKAAKPFTPVVLALMGRKSQNQVVGIWEETFRKAWEATWKDYWEAAWQATYKHGWQEAVHKAFESGVDDALKNKHSEEISHSLKWPSYQPVKGFIQEGDTYSDTLDRMHTMCKELNQLHLALQHSIPISHEETMTIEVNQSTMVSYILLQISTESN